MAKGYFCRRGAIVATCVAIAVGAAAAAIARTGPQELPVAAPIEVESMARSEGISPQLATRSLRAQRQLAVLTSQGRRELGMYFAGVWVEGERIKLAVAEGAPTETRREADALASDPRYQGMVDVVAGVAPEQDLLTLQKRLENDLLTANRDAPDPIDAVADLSTGRVDVLTPRAASDLTSAQSAFLRELSLAGDPRVRVGVGPGRLQTGTG